MTMSLSEKQLNKYSRARQGQDSLLKSKFLMDMKSTKINFIHVSSVQYFLLFKFFFR